MFFGGNSVFSLLKGTKKNVCLIFQLLPHQIPVTYSLGDIYHQRHAILYFADTDQTHFKRTEQRNDVSSYILLIDQS